MGEKNRFFVLLDILLTSLKLGLTSFGGPVAHLAYFKEEYIDRKKWLNDRTYADLIAVCQFLPGPASSQVGISIGMLRGGFWGGLVSWLGFTLPSVIVLVVFALLYQTFSLEDAVFIQSLKVVAAAVVLHALLGMGAKLAPDGVRRAMAVGAAVVMLLFPTAWVQLLVIAAAGITGWTLFQNKAHSNLESFETGLSKKAGVMSLGILAVLLVMLPMLAGTTDHPLVRIFDIFFRVGALVFGGGHVVLPMIEREVVPQGLLSADQFLAGYGMAQAVPGPLFTFSSYLGTMMQGISGAVTATIAIFLPSFLLITAALPFLNELRRRASFQAVLMGVNAAVVGILLAAFYDPVVQSSIFDTADFALGLVLFALLNIWKVPAWMIVLLGAAGGYVLYFAGF